MELINNYLDNLINDHNLIERALILFEKEIAKGEQMNPDIALSLITFLEDYGDECHNQKEEKFYFPLLLERGLPPMGPVAVMLEEHKSERNYLSEIKQIIGKFKIHNKFDESLKGITDEYIELTKNHIWKENDILYPMGKRILSVADGEALLNKFNELTFSRYGQDGYKRYADMIDAFEHQTGGKVNMLATIPLDVVTNMLDALPVELSFVDENDIVRFYTHQNKKKIFHRSLSVIGRSVQKCHPEKSVHLVNQILSEMKAGERDKAEFWINFDGMFVHISYYAVRDNDGKYQGCVEMVHDIKPYRELEGEKRLL